MNFLKDFMEKAYKYGKIDLALEKAQRVFSLAQNLGDKNMIRMIGEFIAFLQT